MIMVKLDSTHLEQTTAINSLIAVFRPPSNPRLTGWASGTKLIDLMAHQEPDFDKHVT